MKKNETSEKGAFPALFEPIDLGPHRLKNRLVALPVYTGYAYPDGDVSSLMTDHYTRLASSGVAMVIVANVAVASDGITNDYTLRLDQDKFISGLSILADKIKGEGAVACLQLNHAGRFAKTEQPLVPSPIDGSNLLFNVASLKNFMNFFPLERRFGLTRYFLKQFSTWRRPMTAEDRDRIIVSFGEAARRAHEAGFDMIEIHGANGYLICQFLSGFTNKTGDDIGNDFHSRTAFPLSVLRRIKKNLPADYPIGFRLLLREWVPEGIDFPEALAWAALLENEGIAYLSATVGTYNSMFSSTLLEQMAKPGYLREDTAQLTRNVSVPTMISGRIVTPSLADRLIREGIAHLIGLGRPLRVDRDWVVKARGKGDPINPCMNCNWCLKGVVLQQGFNCRRWPGFIQERTSFQHKLLSRMYKGLYVVADMRDLARLKASLPRILPSKENIPTAISPTILFLQTHGEGPFSEATMESFLAWGKKTLKGLGFKDGVLNPILREVSGPLDEEVIGEIETGGHGVIVLGRDLKQVWRERIFNKQRGKVLALIGSSPHETRILVPVDLSDATLLVLMFLRQTYMGKQKLELTFLHVLGGSEREARKRWKRLTGVVGFEQDLALKLIGSKGHVTQEILETVKDDNFGTIIMGKRGLSGIKRWLVGSVSSGVMRGLTDETLFLID